MPKNKPALLSLDQYCGTTAYHSLPHFPFVLTDDALALAQAAECFWLMVEIASAQVLPTIKSDDQLQGMQFWELVSNGKGGATLTCCRDEGDPAWQKEIPFTDFPFDTLPKCRVWVQFAVVDEQRKAVAMLPSEY